MLPPIQLTSGQSWTAIVVAVISVVVALVLGSMLFQANRDKFGNPGNWANANFLGGLALNPSPALQSLSGVEGDVQWNNPRGTRTWQDLVRASTVADDLVMASRQRASGVPAEGMVPFRQGGCLSGNCSTYPDVVRQFGPGMVPNTAALKAKLADLKSKVKSYDEATLGSMAY